MRSCAWNRRISAQARFSSSPRLREHGHRRIQLGEDLLRRPRGRRPQQRQVRADGHRGRKTLVAELGGDGGRVGKEVAGGGDLAAGDQRGGQLRHERDPLRRLARQQRVRPAEQRRGGGELVAPVCGDAGTRQVRRCLCSQVVEGRAAFSGVAPRAHGLVEMVPDGDVGVAVMLDRAPREPLVQVGARALREGAVRDVADQAVPERPARAGRVVGFARPDELAPDEREQARRRVLPDERRDVLRRE